MDRMEPALDRMEPAPVAKVGMENKINDATGSQNGSRNLELGEEDNNLAEVAWTNVLTEDTDNTDPDPPPILTIH